MSTNKFGLPAILFEGGLDETDDPGLIGGGSAQGPVPYPCSYTYWKDNYGVNLDSNPEINEADYYIAGQLNKETTGTEPLQIDRSFISRTKLKNAEIL